MELGISSARKRGLFVEVARDAEFPIPTVGAHSHGLVEPYKQQMPVDGSVVPTLET